DTHNVHFQSISLFSPPVPDVHLNLTPCTIVLNGLHPSPSWRPCVYASHQNRYVINWPFKDGQKVHNVLQAFIPHISWYTSKVTPVPGMDSQLPCPWDP